MRERLGPRSRAGLVVGLLALAAVGATETYAASNGSTAAPVEEQQPGALEYTAPQGPLLTDAQVGEIADREAAGAEDASPSDVRAVDASLKSALAIDPHNVVPSAPDPGVAALEASAVVVVSMHGSFTLTNGRVPPGEPAPTGSVLTLILDAHTGQMEGRALTDEEEPGLAGLGALRALE